MSTDIVSSVAEHAARRAPEPALPPLPVSGPAPERLVSLDTFRGFIMFWIIGGEALAAGLQALRPNPILNGLVYELNHTPWQGLRFYDCIWPCFMLMVGVSIPFSLAKRSRSASHGQLTLHALQRATVLFLLGSLRESVHRGSPYWVELSSALQPIAIAYFVAFLLARKSERVQATLAGVIWAGYAILVGFVSVLGVPAGSYQPNFNLVRAIDLAVLGRTYPGEPWGTVVCTLPTISTTLLGLLVGEWLLSARSKSAKLKMMGGAGLLCLALGYGLSPVVPVVMKIWTTSYGLVTAGWACLMFTLFYGFIDVRGYRKGSFPLVVIGANAVFIYMFSSLVPLGEWVRVFTRPMGTARAEPLLQAMLVLTVEWLILFWMYQRKIFVKA